MIRRAIGTMAALVALMLAATSLWADSEVRIVRLSYVDGPVQLDRGTGEGFERTILNMPISGGMRLWTQDDSRAEVEFEEGTSIRLTPGTKLNFSRLALTDDGKRSTEVTIESGVAYVNYAQKKGEDFRIRAGDREIPLTKGAELRIDVKPEHAEIAVLKGELLADGMQVKKNHTAELSFDSGSYQVANGVAPEVADAWNEERTDYHDTYARAGYSGASYYGASDLNYYGSWSDSPYGNCWHPNGFDPSWNPYSSGAWVLYPGYGYSWVSLYPWGWQPYRSGGWNYVGGNTGWCWTPSRGHYGLAWAPVYHAPAGYMPVKPPVQPVNPPPPTITGGPLTRHGPHGIIAVGDVDPTNWRVRGIPSGDELNGGGRYRGTRVSPAAGSGTSNPAGSQTNSNQTLTIDRPTRPSRTGTANSGANQNTGRNNVNEPRQVQREARPSRVDHPAPSPTPRAERPAPAPRAERPASTPPPAPRMVERPAPSPAREAGHAPPPKQ